MKKILVLGGAGFVGRHFVKRLMQEHHQVTVVDDLSTGLHPHDWPEDIYDNLYPREFLHMDCREYFQSFTRAGDFDEVYHCAAVVGGRLKIDGDPLGVATDLAIDSDFFNWVVKKPQPRKVVYFSSSAVYPLEMQTQRCNVQLGEGLVSTAAFTDPSGRKISLPDTTYGWAKLTGEYLAQLAAQRYGLDVAVYRPFSGYGEDQDDSYPFPAILKRVARGDKPIAVWGSGDQCRDFIHIDDVVDAVMATKHLPSGTTLNLGTGIGCSFRDLATTAATLRGIELPMVVNDPSKPEGVFSRVCDPYLLHQRYVPKISLKEGIARMLAWLDKHPESM